MTDQLQPAGDQLRAPHNAHLGLWVTYTPVDAGPPGQVTLHRGEIEALRHALNAPIRTLALFLPYGRTVEQSLELAKRAEAHADKMVAGIGRFADELRR